MGRKTEPKLTSRERLTRGLHYSAVGPVDVTRGVVGISVHSAESAAAGARRRYREAKAARQELAQVREELTQEAAAVKQVVADLPAALQEARNAAHRRHRRLWVFGALGLATAVGGAVAFSIVRRSMQPEPSALPPSVEVAPKP
jgi:Cell wall synthesis protein CwsA